MDINNIGNSIALIFARSNEGDILVKGDGYLELTMKKFKKYVFKNYLFNRYGREYYHAIKLAELIMKDKK